jgi:2'-5' RNA ligase
VRLFVALEPDARTRRHVAEVLQRVQAHLKERTAALRWNSSDNIHVTLHFLGEIEDRRVPSLRASLGDRLPIAPFELETGGLGTFPGSGIPKVLWMAIQQGADHAVRVQEEVGRRLTASGFAIESRPFSPHITLARLREHHRREARGIPAALRDFRIAPVRWTVDRATLFRSHLSSSAPRYEPLQHVVFTDYN